MYKCLFNHFTIEVIIRTLVFIAALHDEVREQANVSGEFPEKFGWVKRPGSTCQPTRTKYNY